MSPVPQGRSLEEIARPVLASLDAAHGNRGRWLQDQAALRELPPTAFKARKLRIAGVARHATVRLGGATYSMPSRWKSPQVHALVGTKEITFTCRSDECRCDLVRPGQRLVRYAHYFEELSRKPQPVRQVAPELLAELGPAYRKQSAGSQTPNHSPARVLRLLPTAVPNRTAQPLSRSPILPSPTPGSPRTSYR